MILPETSNPLTDAALVRCESYESEHLTPVMEKLLSLLGGIETFVQPGDRVLLKPNFIMPKPRDAAAQTDPAVILEIAGIVKDLGAKPYLGDSPAWSTPRACIHALGMEEDLARLGVELVPMRPGIPVEFSRCTVNISKNAMEMDKIINLPKLKAHKQLGATFAVKNMFGTVPGKQKAWWHFAKGKDPEDFAQMLIEIYQKLAPAITIIDAVLAMEGPGPLGGTPRPLNCLAASTDPIALEYLCCELTGIDPETLPIVTTAKKLNFGPHDLSQVNLLGDDPQMLKCPDFAKPEIIPIHFSLPRIIKSVSKQIALVARHRLSQGKHK